jgi:phospholipid/cholesterol/gamma-HCH transport system substrate-binding protein
VPLPTSTSAVRGDAATPAIEDGSGHPGRWLAGVAVALAAVALLAVVLTRDSSHSYRFIFRDAGQLVRGDIVRVGGNPVGDVTGIALTPDGRAEVTVSVDEDWAPLHAGTRATIRAQSLIGIANRYLDVHPGPNFRAELDDGALIDSDNTTAIVELDQFFNALDPPTRRGLEGVIHGFADWYRGKEPEANESARYFAPALVAITKLTEELNRDSQAFEDFLVETSQTMGALSERREELTELVGNAGATARAIATDTESLSLALEELPPAMREGSDTFVALRPALDDLEAFVAGSEDAARALPGFMRELTPFLQTSVPTFRKLRVLFDSPGPGNDLYDAMRDLPPLERQSRTALPRSQRSLRESTPIFSFARPYVPDLTAWLRSFGQAMAPYDANGHYARTMAVFDAFEFVDDAEGGHLEPKPPAQRGRSAHVSLGNLRRCPGAAAPAPSDGSAPFVDSGELANADCDPTQMPGASP